MTSSSRPVLHPGACLDLETADAFRAQVDAVLTTVDGDVVVDLAPTDHIDVAGFAALAYLLVQCRASGRAVALAGPLSTPVRRLLDYSGFDALFEAA
jgi:anti-anti-sigma factor